MIIFSNIVDAKNFISNDENKHIIFENLIEEIQDALIFDSDYIILFKYEKEELSHFLYSKDWITGLKRALTFYEQIENYDKCAEIRDLIIVLEDIFID